MYRNVMLTLLTIATAALAWFAGRPVKQPKLLPIGYDGEALHHLVDSIDFVNIPADAAIAELQRKTGVNIQVDWDAFKEPYEAKATLRSQPITLSMHVVTLADALETLFIHRLNRDVRLDPLGNRIEVAPWAGAHALLITRAYDVSDLISDEYWGVGPALDQRIETDAARIGDLRETITRFTQIAARPRYSAVPPSQDLEIQAFAGRLIVTTTPQGQSKVANLLAWLRQFRPPHH